MLHWVQVALHAAFITSRILIMADEDTWIFVDANTCSSRSWSCYFKPLSQCTESSLKHNPSRVTSFEELQQENTGVVEVELGALSTVCPVASCAHMIPSQFKDQGLLWWRSQLAVFIWKLNPQVLHAVQMAKMQLGSLENAIGVHIRRSDKLTESPPLPIALYATAVSELADRLNTSKIFLVTDSNDVIKQTQTWRNFHIISHEYHRHEIAWWRGIQGGVVNSTTEAMRYLVDMQLLQEMRGFVGAFASNAARLAYELLIGSNKSCTVTSVDMCWIP